MEKQRKKPKVSCRVDTHHLPGHTCVAWTTVWFVKARCRQQASGVPGIDEQCVATLVGPPSWAAVLTQPRAAHFQALSVSLLSAFSPPFLSLGPTPLKGPGFLGFAVHTRLASQIAASALLALKGLLPTPGWSFRISYAELWACRVPRSLQTAEERRPCKEGEG